MKPFGEVSLVRSNESLICLCNGWDGATNDVGAPENRINVLTPRANDILPGIWTGGHRPPPIPRKLGLFFYILNYKA